MKAQARTICSENRRCSARGHCRRIATRGSGSPYNAQRTFREFLKLAGLDELGISLRWYRRTGATVIARGMGSDAAATFLGHTSAAITEGHYIEPDRAIDLTPASHLERTLRPKRPDGTLLAMPPAEGEDQILADAEDVRPRRTPV